MRYQAHPTTQLSLQELYHHLTPVNPWEIIPVNANDGDGDGDDDGGVKTFREKESVFLQNYVTPHKRKRVEFEGDGVGGDGGDGGDGDGDDVGDGGDDGGVNGLSKDETLTWQLRALATPSSICDEGNGDSDDAVMVMVTVILILTVTVTVTVIMLTL